MRRDTKQSLAAKRVHARRVVRAMIYEAQRKNMLYAKIMTENKDWMPSIYMDPGRIAALKTVLALSIGKEVRG